MIYLYVWHQGLWKRYDETFTQTQTALNVAQSQLAMGRDVKIIFGEKEH